MTYPDAHYLAIWTNYPTKHSKGHLAYNLYEDKGKSMEIFEFGFATPAWVIDIRTGEIIAHKD